MTDRPGRKKQEIPPEVGEEVLRLEALRYGTRQIARRVGLSRRRVRDFLEQHRPPPPSGEPQAPPGSQQRASLLDPYRERIRTLVAEGITASRILREIRGEQPDAGYQGGKTILVDYVRVLRAEIAPRPKKVRRRFETDMGREVQLDWSPYDVWIGGELVRVHALGALLCWSRKLYLGFFRNEQQSSLLEGLTEAAEYLEGVAERWVLDNMATAVCGRIGPDRKVLWNERFADFARHMGLDAFACLPGDPDRKGKKEKSFRLVEDDFLRGSKFDSWADLLARKAKWLDGTPGAGNLRKHGTTGRVPNEAWEEEKKFLSALPQWPFPVHEDGLRDVDEDSTLSVGSTRYTVPSYLANTTAAVRLYAHHFEVVDRQGRVAMKRVYVEGDQKGVLQIDRTHYANLPRRPRDRSAQRLDEAFVARFPSLAPLVDGLKVKMKGLAPIHLRELVRLAERFGEPAFLEAAGRAQSYRRFDASAVRAILEAAHPIATGELAVEPLGHGKGPMILGEVEEASLDDYAGLDREQGQGQDASRGPDQEPAQDQDHEPREDDHGPQA